uniref:Uncharacterized protein n=1 Tax=Ascaris lumbricoides TaxID=6252 RepID=A0A0M3I0U4_ASCLU
MWNFVSFVQRIECKFQTLKMPVGCAVNDAEGRGRKEKKRELQQQSNGQSL